MTLLNKNSIKELLQNDPIIILLHNKVCNNNKFLDNIYSPDENSPILNNISDGRKKILENFISTVEYLLLSNDNMLPTYKYTRNINIKNNEINLINNEFQFPVLYTIPVKGTIPKTKIKNDNSNFFLNENQNKKKIFLQLGWLDGFLIYRNSVLQKNNINLNFNIEFYLCKIQILNKIIPPDDHAIVLISSKFTIENIN
jgi:hypothetical protein